VVKVMLETKGATPLPAPLWTTFAGYTAVGFSVGVFRLQVTPTLALVPVDQATIDGLQFVIEVSQIGGR